MASWGIILEPKKKYKQKVQNAYKISQAVLDLSTAGKGNSELLLTVDNNTFILCTLSAAIPQCRLSMKFPKNDVISFSTRGEGTIHLTGYLLNESLQRGAGGDAVAKQAQQTQPEKASKETKNQQNNKQKQDQQTNKKGSKSELAVLLNDTLDDDDDDEDDDDFADLDGLMEDSDDDMGEEEEDDAESGDEDDEDDDDEEDDDEDDEDDEDDDEDDSEEEEIKAQPAKKAKMEKKNEKKEKKDTKPVNGVGNGLPENSKKLPGNVKIVDVKEGNGPVAKPGQSVVVYYSGRLQSNNKVFDSALKGAGFKFRLGRGEVIKGWDVGVVGMKVGGKRTVYCPPHMAYGQSGHPPVIPSNAALVFEIELKKVQ